MKISILPALVAVTALCTGFISYAAEPAPLAGAPSAAADGKFIEAAAQANLAEIKASEEAKDRTKRDDVKHFAKMMVTDHKDVGKNLKTLTDRMNIKLPEESNAEQKAQFDRLKAAADADFDKMYADLMVTDHQKAVALFEEFSKTAANADLKAFATNTLPGLKAHLDHALNLAKAVGAPTAGSIR